MSAPSAETASPAAPVGNPALPAGWLSQWPWVTFVVPLAVFMLFGSLEPKPPAVPQDEAAAGDTEVLPGDVDQVLIGESATATDGADAAGSGWLNLPYSAYPLVYTAKIVLTLLAMALVLPGYRAFRGGVSWRGVAVGAVGAVLWIGLSELQLERKIAPWAALLDWVGLSGSRSAYNPLEQLADNPAWAYGFLAIRFAGLALIVPVIEEFFLRGFLMRFAMHQNWWEVPFGSVSRLAVIVGTAFPMLYHPEQLAALVWFSLVTWLMVRTKSIWECVAAHAVTNGLMGAYAVGAGAWHLM